MRWLWRRLISWSQSPRPSLLGWDVGRGALYVPLLAVGCWATGVQAVRAAVGGAPNPGAGEDGIGAALLGVGYLAAAVASTAWCVLWLRRPTETPRDPQPLTAGRGLFAVVRKGYNAGEVDRFWDGIDAISADELRQVRFSTDRPGYDVRHVDRAIDERIRDRV